MTQVIPVTQPEMLRLGNIRRDIRWFKANPHLGDFERMLKYQENIYSDTVRSIQTKGALAA